MGRNESGLGSISGRCAPPPLPYPTLPYPTHGSGLRKGGLSGKDDERVGRRQACLLFWAHHLPQLPLERFLDLLLVLLHELIQDVVYDVR